MTEVATETKPKRRGRPKGSKNKEPKANTRWPLAAENKSQNHQPALTLTEMAKQLELTSEEADMLSTFVSFLKFRTMVMGM